MPKLDSRVGALEDAVQSSPDRAHAGQGQNTAYGDPDCLIMPGNGWKLVDAMVPELRIPKNFWSAINLFGQVLAAGRGDEFECRDWQY